MFPPLKLAAAGVLALGLAGCYQPPSTRHANLVLSASGVLSFQGRPVQAADLQAAVAAARAASGPLRVVISASPQAPVAAVEAAVHAITGARAQVAFAAASP